MDKRMLSRRSFVVVVIALALTIIVGTLFSSCAKNNDNNVSENPFDNESAGVNSNETNVVPDDAVIFSAYVCEINETHILVTTIDGLLVNLISINLKDISDDSVPALGDVYEITCDGEVEKAIPARLNKIYKMNLIANASKLDDMNTSELLGIEIPSFQNR